jgi:succinoglycan biosynthesis protein ExoM
MPSRATPRVSLIIPTQRRPGGLATAVRSTFRQTGVDFSELELVVVDNDQVPSAQATVEALAAESPFPVIYVHEPEPGIANARNAAMAKARGALIASLDDDEEAPAGWLAALLDVQARFGADAVFGPVRGRAPPAVGRHRAYLEWFFSRSGPDDAKVIDYYHGCGDSLVVRASMPDPVTPFDTARNYIGGEDDLLFGRMQAAGARFAWAPQAWVWEDPQANRLSLAYAIPRAFAYGQGPTEACAAQSPPDLLGVARWMAIGLLQAAAYGLMAGFKRLTGAEDYAFVLDKAARGLGKALWWGPFKIQFYGQRATA